MQLSPTRKKRVAAASCLAAVSFMVYMVSGSGPVGPPYRDENLTAGPEPLMLVMQRSVREELKLTDAQVKQIQSALGKQAFGMFAAKNKKKDTDKDPMTAPRAARMGRKHQEQFLSGVLLPQQRTRLRQIILQRQGGLALNNSKTAEDLDLTETQRKKADAILAKLTVKLNRSGNVWGPEGRKKAEETRKAAGEELLGLLTPQQQNRWKELIGEPFTGEIVFGPPGGPPPGDGRQPDGPGRRPDADPKPQ